MFLKSENFATVIRQIGQRINFLMKFRNNAIVIYEKINENIIAMIAKKFNSALPSLNIL